MRALILSGSVRRSGKGSEGIEGFGFQDGLGFLSGEGSGSNRTAEDDFETIHGGFTNERR